MGKGHGAQTDSSEGLFFYLVRYAVSPADDETESAGMLEYILDKGRKVAGAHAFSLFIQQNGRLLGAQDLEDTAAFQGSALPERQGGIAILDYGFFQAVHMAESFGIFCGRVAPMGDAQAADGDNSKLLHGLVRGLSDTYSVVFCRTTPKELTMPFSLLSLADAVAALRTGGILVYPTETFYGLGCDAMSPDAVGTVYAAKKRPYGLPLPVIIGERGQLNSIVSQVFPAAERLMDCFWPGPLSIIFPARKDVPDLLTAGTRRIAVRLSSHPGAASLCRESGLVLTSSSANISGTPPVTRVDALDPELAPLVSGVFEAQPAPAGGEPSTIVDIVPGKDGQGDIRILRQGVISLEVLNQAGFSAHYLE